MNHACRLGHIDPKRPPKQPTILNPSIGKEVQCRVRGWTWRNLVNLLDGRPLVATGSSATRSTAGEATRSTTRHATGHTTLGARTIEFHHDWVGHSLELLLLVLVLLSRRGLVLIEPSHDGGDFGIELLLVGRVELLIDARVVESVAQAVGVGLETVLRGDASSFLLVLFLILLSFRQLRNQS